MKRGPPWHQPASTHPEGAKYLYYATGAVMNRNTGPPRTTLNKKGWPVIVSAKVVDKWTRVLNPARRSKMYGLPRNKWNVS